MHIVVFPVIGYVNISTIASVTPAQSIINIPITITDNDLTEETEHFTVKACLTSKDLCLQTTVTIIDDDSKQPLVIISAIVYSSYIAEIIEYI